MSRFVAFVCKPCRVLVTLVPALLLGWATTVRGGELGWVTAAPMPTARLALGVVTASNGMIYALGGANGPYHTVEEYNPIENTWATRASMPVGGMLIGAVGTRGGQVYAIGGWSTWGWYAKLNEAYDPATDAWVARAAVTSDRYDFGAAEGVDGKIYAIGGCVYGWTPLGTVEAYDPLADTWTPRTAMPTARTGGATLAANDGLIYVFGGYNGFGGLNDFSHYVATVEAYDPLTDTWTTKAPMPTARRAAAAVQAPNGKIYVIGGEVGETICFATVEAYDPATDTWTTETPLSAPRAYHGAAVANGAIYVVGGYDGAQAVGLVEKSVPADAGDAVPPVSTVQTTPEPSGAWLASDVTVVISASDNAGGSGIRAIHYAVNGGDEVVVAGEAAGFTVTAEGVNRVVYFAVDNAGNCETPKSLDVQIDKSAPVITFAGNQPTYTTDMMIGIDVQAVDAISGVAVPCAGIKLAAASLPPGVNTITRTATDNAGNTATQSVSFTVVPAVNAWQELAQLVRKYVAKAGIANALLAKLAAAQAAAERGDNTAKANILGAFIHEVEAQTGKAIAPAEAKILVLKVQALR